MSIEIQQKQLSADERIQVDKQVKMDLLDHLYQGCLPGTITGVPASVAVFLDFYGYTATNLLIGWLIIFNLMLVMLSILFFVYKKNKDKFSSTTWEWAYSLTMTGCALSWVPCIYLMPSDSVRQILGVIALFLISTGYATGTIGQFVLCIVTMSVIIGPLIIWCFYKGGIFYNILGAYTLTYATFMISANHRSTRWFIASLKLKLENTLVSYQANHDLLTGLSNQRLLPQYIESAINVVKGTDNTFALICFSLNRMEIINDSLGHQAGNSIIQAVTMRLKSLAMEAASVEGETTQYIITLSRSDTFNILLVPLQAEQAEIKIKKIFSVLDELFYLENKGIKVTGCIGISLYGQDGQDTQSLLVNANAAMLKAKQVGGNRLEFYRTEINAELPKQLELESSLHAALKNNELIVYYQPIVDVKTRQIVCMEALLRWKHPVHGFISPLNFIPLAEETGLIVPIGEWVLEEACKQTQRWHEMGFSELRVAVNLSEKQLRHESILDTVKRVMTDTKINPRFLELEITETAILDESVIYIIKEFKKWGLSLAVDDFGTGYSGLSYLKRFSIDKLKIDQSFIRDIPGNSDSMAIVSAIIAMAKVLKISILAEGVETKEQLQYLTERQCDYIQGFYFSKPVDSSLFTELLIKYQAIGMQS